VRAGATLRRRVPALFPALCLAALLTAPASARAGEEAAKEPLLCGRYEERDGLRVLTLWGEPRERGFAHGWLLAEPILEGLGFDLEHALAPLIPRYEALVTKLVVPNFQFTATEEEELQGILAGVTARLGAERLRLEPLGRAVDLTDLKALNTFGDWAALGCSSLALWGRHTADGRPLVGRNFDFPAFDLLIGRQVVVVRAPRAEEAGSVSITYPGSIGALTGLSASGLFAAIHDVRVRPPLTHVLRKNVPRLLAIRRLLEGAKGEGALDAAEGMLRSWPTLYGNNLMLVAPGAPEGAAPAAVFEYDNRGELGRGVTRRDPRAESLAAYGDLATDVFCLACTNHFRAREDPPREAGAEVLPPCWRFGELCGAAAGEGKTSVAGLFEAMGRAALPALGAPQERAVSLSARAEGGFGTLHQVVAEPARGLLHVRFGALGRHVTEVTPVRLVVQDLLEAARPAPTAR
jgi:hypothetical protein